MEFLCQRDSIQELNMLASKDRHSILVEGPEGCGKTFLAKYYANTLGITDFQEVQPKVDSIKEAITTCIQLSSPVVICIENLDTGVPAASYALLKFLEEPSPNIYIVVTCRNIKNVPDTIISRSAVVVTSNPVAVDISSYSINRNKDRFNYLKHDRLWKCVKTFKDAEIVLNMNSGHVEYFHSLETLCNFKDTVSNIIWNISHYPDNTETPVELVVRYIMDIIDTDHVRRAGIECIRDLVESRIGSHAVLAKFVFEVKYCE